jgi:hypothetical protein
MDIVGNGVLPRWIYRYPFDHRGQATLGPVSTWIGDPKNCRVKLEGVLASCGPWPCIGRGIPHFKRYNGTPRLRYSKE